MSSRFYPQIVGSGMSAFVIARGLHQLGHQVTVLTDESIKMELSTATGVDFSVKYIRSLETFAVGKTGLKAPLDDLYLHIRKVNPDIIHVCNFMPMSLITIIRDKLACPVVFSFFNTPVIGKRTVGCFSDPDVENSFGAFVIKANAYDSLILGSEYYVKAALCLGVNRNKILLSYLAPDITSLDITKSVDTSKFFDAGFEDLPYILLPSRITPQKGITDAVKMLSIINNQLDTTYYLVLTGMANPFNHEYATEVRELGEKLSVNEYVLAPRAPVDRTSLAILFKNASLVLIPSWYEGLGLSAIEAQYLRAPLAVSDTVGLSEVVEDGRTGVMFRPKDAYSMSEAVLRVLRGGVDIEEMLDQAQESARKFSIDKHITEIESQYKRLIEKVSIDEEEA